MIPFLKLACTAASWLASIRVPICTPSAPSTTAAAAERASQIPPAAMIGRSTLSATSGSRTIVDAPRADLKPPPSTPSTTKASTPASTAFIAPFSDPMTCTTVMPASCSRAVNNAGSPAEVNTWRTPAPDQFVDDRRVPLPALDHQVGRDRAVGEFAHPAQVGATLGGQRLDHPQTARLGDGGGQLSPGDVGHRRLDDGILDAQERLDAVGHALILCQVASGRRRRLASYSARFGTIAAVSGHSRVR